MADAKLTVSVIVVTYNAASYVERVLENVYSQSRSPDEVLLVDDGSNDGTSEIVKRYPSVRYIYQDNAGPSAARNRGVRLAVGDVIAFLDVDDLWQTDKLKHSLEQLEGDDSIDLVQGRIVDVKDDTDFVAGRDLRLRPLSEAYYFVNLGSWVVRKKAFLEVGLLDEARKENEDTDWFLRAWEKGIGKRELEAVGLYYSIRPNSLSAGGESSPTSLLSILKEHKDRKARGEVMSPKVGLKDFFIGFPDRSKRHWNGTLINLPTRSAKIEGNVEVELSKEENAVAQQFRLARVWKKRGRWKHALESYKRVVAMRPDHIMAHIELGLVLQKCGESGEILEFYQSALERFPNEADLHKAFIESLEKVHGIEKAFHHYDLNRKDGRNITLDPKMILCVFACRNEVKRLPYFLEYYRKLGIDRFFAIDNGSSDGTLELLLEETDVYLWQSGLSFNYANFGSVWFELLLRTYGSGHWCVTVDVDELLVYPDCETVGLRGFCEGLDESGKRVLPTVLLEMYSKGPVAGADYTAGSDFLSVCDHFDPQFYHSQYDRAGPYQNLTYYFGGVRERVFGENDAFCQSKVSLVKYARDCVLAGGQHWSNLSKEAIADTRGCLLHFKYFSDFSSRVWEEVSRKEHYDGALQYKQYVGKLEETEETLTLYDPEFSVRFRDSRQLVDLGIMNRSDEICSGAISLDVPKIAPVRIGGVRPLWSVMVTVYDRVTHLPRCLESILQQAGDPADMQIEVIGDYVSPVKSAEIREVVKSLGGERVSFFTPPNRLGHPHIFNLCIERALGEWVHIVHDDDWLAPGFYEAFGKGIETEKDLGGLFCRYALMGKEGYRKWTSHLERNAPGVIEDWLEKVGIYCRLAFSSKVVRRSAFESLGGFTTSVGSAFDWDMWKRVAMSYPVWFEPDVLSFCGREGDSLTDGLMLSGEQIDDSIKSIEVSRGYLPAECRDRITDAAREHYADYAISLAKRQLGQGLFEAAFHNISSGLKASRSKPVQSKLLRVLSSI